METTADVKYPIFYNFYYYICVYHIQYFRHRTYFSALIFHICISVLLTNYTHSGTPLTERIICGTKVLFSSERVTYFAGSHHDKSGLTHNSINIFHFSKEID
jgi:hypothetical protein